MDMNYIHTEVLKLNKVPQKNKEYRKPKGIQQWSIQTQNDDKQNEWKTGNTGLSQNKWGSTQKLLKSKQF